MFKININPNKKILKLIQEDFKLKKIIYKPTSFWKDATKHLMNIFLHRNIKDFKNKKFSNNFFIPVYNLKREIIFSKFKPSINKKILIKNFSKKFLIYYRNFINGKLHAFSDYRVFKSADDIKKYPLLNNFTETSLGNPVDQFEFDKKKFSRTSLNYLLGLVFLKKNTKNFIPRITLEIGGGYGALGEILNFSKIRNFKYINVDLPPQAYLTELYLLSLFGKSKITSYSETRKMVKIYIKKLKNFTSLVTWQIENLNGKIDLFINFISFQEMEPNVVKNYLNIITKLKPKFILLRNIKEGKQLKKKNITGVTKKIKSDNYISFLKKNYYLLNRNTIPFGYRTYDNFNSELLLFKKN